MQLGQVSLSSHLLHHAPCPTLVIPFKSLSSEGSVPEALPPHAAIGEHVAGEISPRDAAPDASPAGRPGSAGITRRTSIGVLRGFGQKYTEIVLRNSVYKLPIREKPVD